MQKVVFIACIASALIAIACAQNFSQETCQKATQAAPAKITKALREETKKFQSKLQNLATNSFNVNEITSQVDSIVDEFASLAENSNGNISVQQLTGVATNVSTQYIKLGTSFFNTRAPLEAYSAYFSFLYSSGNRIAEIVRSVQQSCTPTSL